MGHTKTKHTPNRHHDHQQHHTTNTTCTPTQHNTPSHGERRHRKRTVKERDKGRTREDRRDRVFFFGEGNETMSARERASHEVIILQVTTTNLSNLTWQPISWSTHHSAKRSASQRLCLTQDFRIIPSTFWSSFRRFFRGRRITFIHFFF